MNFRFLISDDVESWYFDALDERTALLLFSHVLVDENITYISVKKVKVDQDEVPDF